jgi:hypothetical protein
MSTRPLMPLLALVTSLAPIRLAAQSVMVDEGTFALTIGGKPAGTETFQIRRSGMGNDAIVIAQGRVDLNGPDGRLELDPLLETDLPQGAATSYHLKVSGAKTAELSLKLAGRRYVSLIRSDAGEEEREFLARPETHILEEDVAHQYYFLHTAREGERTPVIEPRTRKQLVLTASASSDERLQLGPNLVQARRVTFSAGGTDERTVWFDRQGRVLKVEIPARSYVAQRQDLVG